MPLFHQYFLDAAIAHFHDVDALLRSSKASAVHRVECNGCLLGGVDGGNGCLVGGLVGPFWNSGRIIGEGEVVQLEPTQSLLRNYVDFAIAWCDLGVSADIEQLR